MINETNNEEVLLEREEQLQDFAAVINRIGTRLATENGDLDTFDYCR